MGDIGCYTLGALPPLSAMDITLCMGASVGAAHGFVQAGPDTDRPVCAVIGDSTFVHSGITGLVDIGYNAGTVPVIVLDNRTTAMTGHQTNPAQDYDLTGNPSAAQDIERILTGMIPKDLAKDVRLVRINPADRRRYRQLLEQTILADDPRLTRRLGLNPVSGWRRVILDSGLRTPTEATVVQSQPESTLIYHTSEASAENRRRLREAGVELVELRAGDDGRVALGAALDDLARREVAALLVEGGPTVHGSFNDAELVDEVALFIAPFIIGGDGPPAVAGRGIASLEAAKRLVFEDIERYGDDLEIRAVRPEETDVHGAD